jgi:hypothetical protein
MGGDGNFRVSALILAKTKTIADDLFVSPNGCLDAAALVVARGLLPADFTLFGNTPKIAITLRRLGLRRLARHRGGAWRHDHRSAGIAVNHGAVNAVLIVSAITGERGQRSFYLVEQRTRLGRVIHIVCYQFRSDDLAGVGVRADMQLPP